MPKKLTESRTRNRKEPTFSVDIINMIIKAADRFGIDPERNKTNFILDSGVRRNEEREFSLILE